MMRHISISSENPSNFIHFNTLWFFENALLGGLNRPFHWLKPARVAFNAVVLFKSILIKTNWSKKKLLQFFDENFGQKEIEGDDWAWQSLTVTDSPWLSLISLTVIDLHSLSLTVTECHWPSLITTDIIPDFRLSQFWKICTCKNFKNPKYFINVEKFLWGPKKVSSSYGLKKILGNFLEALKEKAPLKPFSILRPHPKQ